MCEYESKLIELLKSRAPCESWVHFCERVKQRPSFLQMTHLFNFKLKGVNLSHADLPYDCRWVDFEDANLAGANLKHSNLECANFKGAYLEDADLRFTNLKGANFESAYFYMANFWGADLEEVNLKGADLRLTNLGWTNLKGVINLEEAHLNGANIRVRHGDGVIIRSKIIGEKLCVVHKNQLYIDRLVFPLEEWENFNDENWSERNDCFYWLNKEFRPQYFCKKEDWLYWKEYKNEILSWVHSKGSIN